MSHSSNLKTFLIILLASLFSGCAITSQVNFVAPITAQTTITDQQGYVVAKVVNAGAIPLPFSQLTMAPIDLNESDEILPTRLAPLRKLDGNTTMFASAVDIGRYSLSSIRSFHSNGQYWYDRWVSADVELGTFEVKPGNITDLGTIIYYPKAQKDRLIETLIRAPSFSNNAIIHANLPFFSYDPDTALTWNEDDYDDDRLSAYTNRRLLIGTHTC